MPGKEPDYDVHAMDKSTDAKARIGAAWKNEGGRIGIVLNNFVKLEGSKNLVITLFPCEGKEERASKYREQSQSRDDEKPF